MTAVLASVALAFLPALLLGIWIGRQTRRMRLEQVQRDAWSDGFHVGLKAVNPAQRRVILEQVLRELDGQELELRAEQQRDGGR